VQAHQRGEFYLLHIARGRCGVEDPFGGDRYEHGRVDGGAVECDCAGDPVAAVRYVTADYHGHCYAGSALVGDDRGVVE
jgi:hypothetical protein